MALGAGGPPGGRRARIVDDAVRRGNRSLRGAGASDRRSVSFSGARAGWGRRCRARPRVAAPWRGAPVRCDRARHASGRPRSRDPDPRGARRRRRARQATRIGARAPPVRPPPCARGAWSRARPPSAADPADSTCPPSAADPADSTMPCRARGHVEGSQRVDHESRAGTRHGRREDRHDRRGLLLLEPHHRHRRGRAEGGPAPWQQLVLHEQHRLVPLLRQGTEDRREIVLAHRDRHERGCRHLLGNRPRIVRASYGDHAMSRSKQPVREDSSELAEPDHDRVVHTCFPFPCSIARSDATCSRAHPRAMRGRQRGIGLRFRPPAYA